MIVYGPSIENINAIHDRAKSRKDGVYSFRGIVYRVKSGRFTHYADGGKILERCGHFNVIIGSYTGYYFDSAKAALKSIRD